MPVTCLVFGCKSRAYKDVVNFFAVPSVLQNNSCATNINDLSIRRRERWIAALNRDDLTESMLRNQKVCSKHFITGKPASLENESDPDWVPSQNMGQSGISDKHVKDVDRQRIKKRTTSEIRTPPLKVIGQKTISKCMVLFCKNYQGKKNGVEFYRLTKKRYNSWMRSIGRNPKEKLSLAHHAICSDHFSVDSFLKVGNSRILKSTALPTLNVRPPEHYFQTLLKLGNHSPQTKKRVVFYLHPSTSLSSKFNLSDVSSPNSIRPIQLDTKDIVIPAKHSISDALTKPSSGSLKRSVTKLQSQLPSSQDLKKVSFSKVKMVEPVGVTADDGGFAPGASLRKDDSTSKIKIDSKQSSRRRYSVRMWHNYYVCPRKQKNKLDMIKEESKNMQLELKMATFCIKTLASDVKRLTERVDDLTDIVKLYVHKSNPSSLHKSSADHK